MSNSSSAAETNAFPSSIPSGPVSAEAQLRETLKRCSARTIEAACGYRATHDPALLPVIVTGVIERYVERSLRPKLAEPPETLRLAQDLNIDSLTMLEIVMLAEDVLQITISNDELRQLATLRDVQDFIATKVTSAPAPK